MLVFYSAVCQENAVPVVSLAFEGYVVPVGSCRCLVKDVFFAVGLMVCEGYVIPVWPLGYHGYVVPGVSLAYQGYDVPVVSLECQ